MKRIQSKKHTDGLKGPAEGSVSTGRGLCYEVGPVPEATCWRLTGYCLPATAWVSYSSEVNICGIQGLTADPRERGLGSEVVVVHLVALDDLTVHESLHTPA